MKVLKFGGTSVGTVESLQNVKKIVESCQEPVIVVVSALGGLTDKLIATAKLAEARDESYQKEFKLMVDRHHDIINRLVPEDSRQVVTERVNELLGGLLDMYCGISLIEELSSRSLDKVVSFGERLSSTIIANIIEGARLFESPKFIKTLSRFGKHLLDSDLTDELIHDTFDNEPYTVAVVPGFIATDYKGIFTNLGRGGSDYTAAILAAALDADTLEIWTDVDGFLTADPRIVTGTKVIPSLSFTEAMELCNFGAKVIYPPTIYPVFHKNIPIYIKNTFNPDAPGTCVYEDKSPKGKAPVRGVSSIKNSCLLTVESKIANIDSYANRLLNTLTRNGVSVALVSKSSDNRQISFALSSNDLEQAGESLEKEFTAEFETGEFCPLQIRTELSTLAIVGDNMRYEPAVADEFFQTLRMNDIEVLACSQGAPETSLAAVIPLDQERQALQAVHDRFFCL